MVIRVSGWLRSDNGIGPFDKLLTHASEVCTANPFAYRVNDGQQQIVSQMDPQQRAKLAEAQQAGVKIAPTIVDSPWDHPEIVAAILDHPDSFIAEAVKLAVAEGYDGLDLDWESIPLSAGVVKGWTDERVVAMGPKFTAFVSQLAAALHAHGKTLSVTAISKTGHNDWSGAEFFDYPALGRAVDWLEVMAYDENYGTGNGGPTASLKFVNERLAYALSVVPAHKVKLGIPFYGYQYHGEPGDPSLTWSQAQAILPDPGTIRRDGPEIVYNHGPVLVYMNDACSIAVRISDLYKALQHHGIAPADFGGVAVYPIGDEPAGYWDALAGRTVDRKTSCLG